MEKYFFIYIFTIFITSVSSDSECDDPKQRLAIANMALSGKFLYRHFSKYPTRSYTFVSLPVFCILGDLAFHTKCESHQQIMDLLDMKNEAEIKQLLPEMLSYLEHSSDTLFKVTHKVFSDRNQKFTRVFKKNYAVITKGRTGYLNYCDVKKAVKEADQWFAKQSNHPPMAKATPSMFQGNDKGLFYATSMDFIASLDHEYNPNKLVLADYHMNETVTYPAPSLQGNGLARYANVKWLDTQVISFPLKGGNLSVVFFYPNSARNLLKMLRAIQDPSVFYKALAETEWMCLNMKITVGHANVGNDIMDLLPELHVNTTDLYDVFESGDLAQVNTILQQLHLFADTEVREGPINSKYCPGDNLPSVVMNHPCSYYVITPEGMPVYAGILYGVQDYKNVMC